MSSKAKPIDWFRLLDELKKRKGISTDTQLATELGIKKSWLSQVKSGTREMSGRLKLKILDKLGYAITRDVLLEALLTKDAAAALRDWDNKRLRKPSSGDE